MAAPTLSQIRAGLATNLGSIADTQVSAYALTSLTPPSIQVLGPENIDYHEAMQNGMDSWVLLVQAFVGTPTDIGAQKQLDAMIGAAGASSVKAAIESDKTLGGTVSDLIVRTCSGYRQYARENGRVMVLGAEWTVEVIADGA